MGKCLTSPLTVCMSNGIRERWPVTFTLPLPHHWGSWGLTNSSCRELHSFWRKISKGINLQQYSFSSYTYKHICVSILSTIYNVMNIFLISLILSLMNPSSLPPVGSLGRRCRFESSQSWNTSTETPTGRCRCRPSWAGVTDLFGGWWLSRFRNPKWLTCSSWVHWHLALKCLTGQST